EDLYVEAGYGGVLTKLVKRIDRDATRISVGDSYEWDLALGMLNLRADSLGDAPDDAYPIEEQNAE
ncbi:MAG: hypothetical protein LUB61_06475, partial [Eggerthellaceae bacterium]|nr:hypothetical protein [Eggerthellaceae bacterium]